MAFPGHQDSMLKVDDRARRLEMCMDPCKVIHQESESEHLFAKWDFDLVELHLVKHFLIKVPYVLAKAHTVNEYLDVGTFEIFDVIFLSSLDDIIWWSSCLEVAFHKLVFFSLSWSFFSL